MLIVGILLVVAGFLGLAAGTMAFGDIGIACALAGIVGLLSGIGFIIVSRKWKSLM